MRNEKNRKKGIALIAAALYGEEVKKMESKRKVSRPIRVHSGHIKQRDKTFFNLRRGFSKLNVRV